MLNERLSVEECSYDGEELLSKEARHKGLRSVSASVYEIPEGEHISQKSGQWSVGWGEKKSFIAMEMFSLMRVVVIM